MSSAEEVYSTKDELREIVAITDPAQRSLAVQDWLRSRDRYFARVAASLCRSNSVSVDQHADDIASILRTTAWEMVESYIADPARLEEVGTWEALHRLVARPKVRSHTDHVLAPASGMVTVRRRRREAERSRSELRTQLGREPEDAEIISVTNARAVKGSRSAEAAAAQGRIVSEADLRTIAAVDVDSVSVVVDLDEGFLLHPSEGRDVVERIVAACLARDAHLGRVAQLWLADVYDGGSWDGDGDERSTVHHIARTMRVHHDDVRRLIIQIRVLAVEILAELGIIGEAS